MFKRVTITGRGHLPRHGIVEAASVLRGRIHQLVTEWSDFKENPRFQVREKGDNHITDIRSRMKCVETGGRELLGECSHGSKIL